MRRFLAERDDPAMKTIRLLIIAALIAVTIAALPTFGSPRASASSGLTPAQRMCTSADVIGSMAIPAQYQPIVSCTLDVPSAGVAYINASGSLFISPNSGNANIAGSISVDGTVHETTSGHIAHVYANSNDGSDRSFGTQLAIPVGPGAHEFSLVMAQVPVGTGTALVFSPRVQVFFAADPGDVRGCSNVLGPEIVMSQLSLQSTVSCSLTVAEPGTVRVTYSAEVEPVSITADALTVLQIDGAPSTTTEPASRDGLTNRTRLGKYAEFTNTAVVNLVRVEQVGTGPHTFALAAASAIGTFRILRESIQAVFIPTASTDSTHCRASKPEESAPASDYVDVVSCAVTLPRAGTLQAIATTTTYADLDDTTAQYRLAVDGVLDQATNRYMDTYGQSGGNTTSASTIATQVQRTVSAGTHTVTLRIRRYETAGLTPRSFAPWLSVLAAFPEPDAPPVTIPPPTTTPAGGGKIVDFVPLVPERVLDTRSQSQVGYAGPKPGAGQIVEVQATGFGTSEVPTDARAVVLNLTGSQADADGYVTAWPCGSPQPTASNLNVKAGANVPNLVVSKVGAGGRVCLYTQSSQHLIADVSGYMPGGSRYVPLVPERFLDTRPATRIGYDGTKPTADQTVQVHVTGTGASDVPADAAAVVMNVTGTEAPSDGYVTVWPCGSPRPLASSLNLAAGTDRPNLVISKVGDGGNVCVYTQNGAHLIADISGYLPAGTSYVPLVPARILETRPTQVGYVGDKPGAGTTVEVHVIGTGTPAVPADATAVVLNVTGTAATGDGYVTIWPCGSPRPTASNLNLTTGATAPNLVMSKLGEGGKVCVYTQSGAHLIADLAGYWTV